MFFLWGFLIKNNFENFSFFFSNVIESRIEDWRLYSVKWLKDKFQSCFPFQSSIFRNFGASWYFWGGFLLGCVPLIGFWKYGQKQKSNYIFPSNIWDQKVTKFCSKIKKFDTLWKKIAPSSPRLWNEYLNPDWKVIIHWKQYRSF